MRLTVLLAGIVSASAAFPQQPSPSARTPPKELPKLSYFNATNVDTKADPCDDFYGYADAKWLAAHPIPPDEVSWGVGSPLQIWNETVLVQTLEQNQPGNPNRIPNEQKVGDFYFACMDTRNIDAHTTEWLKPELDRLMYFSVFRPATLLGKPTEGDAVLSLSRITVRGSEARPAEAVKAPPQSPGRNPI